MSSFSFGAIYCPLRGLYWLDSSPMICGGFYAGASPRRSLRPKGIDLRGRWFAPAQNTLASTATHRQTNDSKKLLPFFVGLSIRPLRGLFLAWFVDGQARSNFCRLVRLPVARSFLTWCMDGQARKFFVGMPSLRCAVCFWRGLDLCSRKRSNKYAVLSGSFALILHLASWTEIDRTDSVK